MISWVEKTVKVNELKPYEKNPRRISAESFDRLKKSLTDLGYHQRIIATPDLRIIGGHQRIKALKDLGIKSVQILVPNKELSDNDFKRLLIQDNLPFGDFDFEMLANDFNVEELLEWGMPESWLGQLTQEPMAGLTDADDVPETPANPVTKLGDVWIMGNHRIICGDSTSAMENNSSVGQAVYEPFSGSGTSIIAGEQIGRHVYAIELNPAYVDVAVKRWQDFTGQEATLESSGKTFNELSNGVG